MNNSDNNGIVNGVTVLTYASCNGHDAVVRELIKSNADTNIATKEGVTALMVASENGHIVVVKKHC